MQASEAARHLFAVRQAPEGLARTLLSPLVEDDARLAWRGSFVALASVPDPRLADDRVRRLRSRDDRPLACLDADLRDRRRPDPGARARRHVPDPRRAEDCRAAGRAAPHRTVGRCAAASAGRADGDPAVLGVRRLIRADRAQRALRRRVREPRARTDDRQAARRHRDRHRPARPESPCGAASSERASPRSPTSSACPSGRAIARFPTRRRQPRSSCGSSSSRPSAEPRRSPSSRSSPRRGRGGSTRSAG